jgi:gliding motility-associated lipoprotein GldH
MTKAFRLLAAFIPVMLLVACHPDRVYEQNVEINKYIWNKDVKTKYEVTIEDTTQHYDIYVNVRHTNFYYYSNLWIMVYTTFPDGHRLNQRVELQLAEKDGKWDGECLGDICDISLELQKNAIFDQKGKYIFEFEQIMRHDQLPAIMAMGLKIEKTKR